MNSEEARRILNDKKIEIEKEMNEAFPIKKFEIDIFTTMGGYHIELTAKNTSYRVWVFTGYQEAWNFLSGMYAMFVTVVELDLLQSEKDLVVLDLMEANFEKA